jgi:hypothetical protein
MAVENEKAMGPIRPPMASHPTIGIGFMDDPCQNRNKRNRSWKIGSWLSLKCNFKRIESGLSSEIWPTRLQDGVKDPFPGQLRTDLSIRTGEPKG